MRIVLIGAGRLATNLGQALHKAGHEIIAVFSRTLSSAEALASLVGAKPTDNFTTLPLEAELFIIAVKDAVLENVITKVTENRKDQVFVHTAGSMPLDIFKGKTQHYGVFYPMQTFSKERLVDFTEIPIFLEASDDKTLQMMHELADSITHETYELSTENRKHLHLAAVFACNFVNHCYALSAEVLEQHSIPFKVMLPLIDETARKVHELHPHDAQTGPAVRYDENVINAQEQLLSASPDTQEIYHKLTTNIHKTHTRCLSPCAKTYTGGQAPCAKNEEI